MDTTLFFAVDSALPPGVGFRHFGPAHLLWLGLSALLCLSLCLRARSLDRDGRARLRRRLGAAVLLCEALKDANLIAQGVFGLRYLPLHLCSLAVFLTAWHSLRPGQTLGNLLYSTCMPGAAFALLFPDWTAYPPFAYHSIVGFTVHVLLTAYPLVLLAGGDFRPSVRALPRCALALGCLAAPVYLLDRALNVNYMFLLLPAPDSPLEWFASFLGVPGYLLGLAATLACVWAVLFLPFCGFVSSFF